MPVERICCVDLFVLLVYSRFFPLAMVDKNIFTYAGVVSVSPQRPQSLL
jgi:hypothetical protein